VWQCCFSDAEQAARMKTLQRGFAYLARALDANPDLGRAKS
jgi:hypothetical protein